MSEKMKQPQVFEHNVSVEEARRDIESNFPDFTISSIELAGEGFTNVAFLVNDEYIFRFAKRTRASTQIHIESKLLPQLESKLNLPIPHVEYIGQRSENQFAFMGYKKIVGETLEKDRFEKLDETTQDKIISTIAAFIKALHSFPIEQATDAGVETKKYKEHYEHEFAVVKEKVYPYVDEKIQKQLEMIFEEYLSDGENFNYTPSLVHAEICPKHILVNEGNEITGVIDFGDMQIGDPDFEFYYPYHSYGSEFTSKLLKHLPENDETRIMKKMKFFALYHSIIQIIFIGIRENEGALKKGLKDLEEFMENDSTF